MTVFAKESSFVALLKDKEDEVSPVAPVLRNEGRNEEEEEEEGIGGDVLFMAPRCAQS